MVEFRPSSTIIAPLLLAIAAGAFSSSPSGGGGIGGGIGGGGGFGAPISLDRFRATTPADLGAVRRFDPTLLDASDGKNSGGRARRRDDCEDDDVWVAVYRSANNLPSVYVRDSFFEAMRVSTTTTSSSAGFGDSETLVSFSSSSSLSSSSSSDGAMLISNGNDDGEIPVAVARLGRRDADSDTNNDYDDDDDDDDEYYSSYYIIDSMRCSLRKEDTDPDCDGGSEHAEAIGICIDELVLEYLRRHSEMERGGGDDDDCRRMMSFDGGIRFRGTLVSGRLLDSRGFREVDELSADMHSHESDYDGALDRYSERSTSRDVAKYPGARDRALRIVSYLGRMDREEDKRRSSSSRRARAEKKRNGDAAAGDDDGGEGDSDFDPWASVKRYL